MASGMERNQTLSDEERRDWLRLIRTENVGPITFHALLHRFGSATAALAALPDLSRRGGRRGALRIPSRAAAERELIAVERLGASLIASVEPDYPEALAATEDAPPLLSVMGHRHLLRRPMVAIVGARNASANGLRFARSLAGELGRHDLVVVSGLARGIDGAAHEGALASGTVAVMAGGLDKVYPREHEALFERVCAEGAAVSEMAPGVQPQARHFPPRNRLVAGMSLGVVVVEAARRSGSLITARLALEQGREVMAVPGMPTDPRAEGPNHLIRQGATLVTRAEDVIEALAGALQPRLDEPPAVAAPAGQPAAVTEIEVDSAHQRLQSLLGPAPVVVDELIRECQLSAPAVLTALLELELAGRLERHAGGRVSLVAEPQTGA
ncbi:MAG: DNA-processing protein DprA [Alphaproteobacteria bacterium]